MKKTLLTLLVTVAAFAQCQPYVLGAKTQNSQDLITTENSLVFKSTKGKWSVSSLQKSVNLQTLSCKEQAFVLANNNNISYEVPKAKANSYSLKRGWNALSSYAEGVDVVKTFQHARGVEFVYVYDKPTKAWAGYSPLKENETLILGTRILSLKKIEPNRKFYVYAKNSVTVQIESTPVSGVCKKYMSDNTYAFLTDSGIDDAMVYNVDKSMGVKSRYLSHYKRGIYNESRITLIYPKLETKEKVGFKYGPAVPKSMLEYAKEYEEMKFYMFDYKENKCYEGTFPSMKVPPFASLKELK